MEIRRVGVIGCGLVGAGTAQVSAQAGYQVVFLDLTQRRIDEGFRTIRSSLDSRVQKGRMAPEESKAVLGRLTGTTEWEDLVNCDILIEAVVEDLAEKHSVLRHVDRIAPSHALVATSTSSLCVAELASVVSRPERVLGLHFSCPVPVMKLVELVRAYLTGDAAVAEGRRFAESLGKTVILSKDRPGFVLNRLLVPFLMEAVRALEAGVASREDIDEGIRKGLGNPLGPLQVLDLVGLDTAYLMSHRLFEETKDPRFAPPRLLKEMVVSGFLGRKTGRGFYTYGESKETS